MDGRGYKDIIKNKTYCSRSMKINPSKIQKNTARFWMDCGRSTYNMTVDGVSGETEKINKYEQRNRFVTRKKHSDNK